MVINKIKAIAAARARVEQLEEAISRERVRELAGLPAKFGFQDLGSFIAAVKAVSGGKGARRSKAAAAPKRRKRALITDAVRARAKALVKAGKTGSQIAQALGISLPSVQNIKKALGLVRSAKKPARPAKARKAPAKRRALPKPPKKRAAPKKTPPPTPSASPSAETPAVVPA